MPKTKKTKIPKRIVGIKVPKDLRKTGDALIEKAGSPAGREAITAGLAMAATMAVAAMERQRVKKAAASRTDETTPEPAQGVQNPQAIADAIGGVADMVMGRIFGAKKAG